jgi:ribosomal protein S27E
MIIRPIHGQRDKWYLAVHCKNCERHLPLVEIPPKGDRSDAEKQVEDATVKCEICKAETIVAKRAIYLLEFR